MVISKFLKNSIYPIYYFVLGFLLLIGIYNIYYSNKVLPGVYLAGKNVSGYSKDQLIDYMSSVVPSDRTIKLTSQDKEYNISFDNISLEYDIDSTASDVLNAGRRSYFSHLYNTFGYFVPIEKLDYKYTIDNKKLDIYLASFAADNFPKNKNAYFYLQDDTLFIEDASSGKDIDVAKIKTDLLEGLPKAQFDYVLSLQNFQPSFYASDLEKLEPIVNTFINSTLQFTYEAQVFTPTTEELLSLLDIEKGNETIGLAPNKNGMNAYISSISAKINTDPKSFKLSVDGDNVNFEPPIVGKTVNGDAVYAKTDETIQEFINNPSEDFEKQIAIEVSTTKPSAEDNEYGITELISEGVSYFVGSSSSRISNIVTASNKLSGTLVAPGENFSFNEAVGPITLEEGFNESYVISKGRTVLGTGGGVCQTSTTVYRAALLGGFPIVDRTAHAYRVSYYEQKSQLGLDATIYQPSVDFVFKNDTDHYILVYSEVDAKNTTMKVKIYGTSDDRTVELSESKQVTQLPPPEPKYIETDKLPKGEIKQVEWPSWGGLVTYTRVVKDKNGKIIYNDEFKNYYTPWAAVYEKGV